MKLHALELTGFGPFRETQRVDFDAFDRDGVFLISGRTGAGKSSILDGVSFALYGTVPRYDGGDKRLRSDHSAEGDPTEVRLEFTIDAARWRVTRSPDYDRPAKRGGGVTTQKARAELEELVGETWVGRAAGPRDVGLALSDLLGLGAQQFQQVILLAQNKFSRFLLAPDDERQALLRALFGTRRFEQYRNDLDQRRRDAEATLTTATEHARTLLELAEQVVTEHELGGETDAGATDAASRRDALLGAQSRADYRAEQAGIACDQAAERSAAVTVAHALLIERAEQVRQLATGRERLAELEAQAPVIDEARTRLTRGRRAEGVRAQLDALARAEAADAHARRDEDAARSAWSGGAEQADATARIDELTADLARWEDAAAQERDLVAARERLAALTTSIAVLDERAGILDDLLAAYPAARAERDGQIATTRAAAARAEDLLARQSDTAAQLAAAREAAELADTSAQADQAQHEASVADSAATAAVSTLLERRLSGYAGELAAGLVAGEPCAVCGSTAHPHPAETSAEPVTDDDIAVAEQARDTARAAAQAASEKARAAREQLAAVRVRSGGLDEEALATLLGQLDGEAESARRAATELELLLAQRDEAEQAAATRTTERAELAQRRAADGAELAVVGADISRSEASISAARGEFASVRERIADAKAERGAARRLVEASARAAEQRRTLAAARADVDARLAETGFDSADAARAALVSQDEQARLDAQISGHAASLAAAKERLLELELVAGGDDVTAEHVMESAAAVAAADEARTTAIAARSTAEQIATRLHDLSRQADDAYGGVAAVTDDAAAITRLADTVAGRAPNTMKMDLETFVLAAELEEIVAAANVRLEEMSAGRYSLHHTDARAARGRASGLGIEVFDAHTGRYRAPQSLSGGETFLASLALALGLGEVVTSRAGGIRLDTLFVDEGFGSLDPETLELAMRTLDELRAGGRTVGVISHVEAMKEQLPAQIVVEATPQGPSIIRQDDSVAGVLARTAADQTL